MGSEGRASRSTGHTISFGRFCLQTGAHQLLEGDKPVAIGARALDLLIFLVHRAGDLVTKDELLAGVWPGLTVDETNLRAQVALLRRALRDGEDGFRYVMTVPGRGYRFVAAISSEEARSTASSRLPSADAALRLPLRLTRLIGRGSAVADILEQLNDHRFVTIIGPGGIGKTSVALAVAERALHSYDDGVHVVDCAPLQGTSLVARKLASTLELEIAADDPTRGLVAFLRGKRMLIILDSCEQVAEAAGILVENLLKGAPEAAILATSREPLRAEGEVVYRLPPLETPPVSGDMRASDALAYPAVELFVERVKSSLGSFEFHDADAPVVADICRRLDGIALAIELAAGRVDVFGVLGVAARLEDRITLLTSGRRTALPRHRTLAATLDWSYDALTEAEQMALRQLSIFAGSFTLDGAEAVAMQGSPGVSVVEAVASLVSKSLLNADVASSIGRYRLLDTTRAYALNKLKERGELEETARRHASYIKKLLEKASDDAATSSSMDTTAQLSAESKLVDEARSVIDWALSSDADLEIAIALAVASVPLWTHLSLNGECCRCVERVLVAGRLLFAPNDRREMQLLTALGSALVWTKGPGSEADQAFFAALSIAEFLGDADYKMRILWGLWSSHFNSGRIRLSLDTAKQFRDVAATHGDNVAELVGERTVGMSLFYLGEHAPSRRHAEAMLRGYLRPRNRSHIVRFQFDPRIVSRTLLSKLLWAQGFPDQAMSEARGVVREATEVGHAMSLALTLAQGACPVSLLSGDLTTARTFTDLMLKHTLEHALDLWHAWGTCLGAMLKMAEGNIEEGLNELNETLEELAPGAFFIYYAGIQATLAEAFGKVGELSKGFAVINGALERSERDQERWYLAEFLRVKGDLLRREDSSTSRERAESQFLRSIQCAKQQGALSWELRSSTSLAQLYQSQGKVADARSILMPILGRFTEGFQTADLTAARNLLEAGV